MWPGNKTAAFAPYELGEFTPPACGIDTSESNSRPYAELAGCDMRPGFYGDRITERNNGQKEERKRKKTRKGNEKIKTMRNRDK